MSRRIISNAGSWVGGVTTKPTAAEHRQAGQAGRAGSWGEAQACKYRLVSHRATYKCRHRLKKYRQWNIPQACPQAHRHTGHGGARQGAGGVRHRAQGMGQGGAGCDAA